MNCLRQNCLTVFDQKPDTIKYGYYEIMDVHELIECKDENLLLTTPLGLMFRGVKKLKTSFYSMTLIEMSKFYNQFVELEELSCYHYYGVSKPIILNLQRLKKLSVKDSSNYDLRCPNLTQLKAYDFRYCLLYYPERLRRLEANLFEHREIDYTKLTNLELLVVSNYDWWVIQDNFPAAIKNLRELHFTTYSLLDRETLTSSSIYKRKNLKLCLFGFDIHKNLEILEEDLDDFSCFLGQDQSDFIVRNYEKTAPTVYHRFQVDYKVLAQNGLEESILSKFVRLTDVKATARVEDEDSLLGFLFKAKPRVFQFENHFFSPNFLNRFALQCNSIRRIELNNRNLDITNPEIEFLFKMKNLTSIYVLQEVSLDFVVRAFEHCKHLRDVRFHVKDLLYASFCPYDIDVYSVKTYENGEEEVFRTSLTLKNKTSLCHFLCALRRELKPNNRRTSTDTLIFAVENYKRNQRLVVDHFMKVVRNELFYIYSFDSSR